MTGKSKRGIESHIKRRKRVRSLLRVLALFIVCTMPFLLFEMASAVEKSAKIMITAENGEILQGEAMPGLKANVTSEESKDIVLDKESKYTVDDLVKDLKSGKWYTLDCKADPNVEGTYKIKVKLNKELRDKVDHTWGNQAEIAVKDGKFKVKNPVGDWDGDKFRKYGGSYVTNDFVVSMGKSYYFGEDGTKVTGWQTIHNAVYFFDEEGVMQASCWKENEGSKYYLSDRGFAVTGWQDIDGATYYFDRDAKMATGVVYIGLALCEFDENGKLVSKKESNIDLNKPMVALTFDDGPGDRTKEILAQLEKYNAHATFFVLGKKVPSYADDINKMKEIRCEIGNHSYDHANLSKLDANGVKNQVGNTNHNIAGIIGKGVTVMRPTYGAISETLKANVGMPMILWNIDTLDWKTRNAQKTIDTVMSKAKDGDIILMHDIHTESVDAALVLIPKLEEAGFQLVTVSELAAAKGVELKNGEKYTDFR